MSITITEERKAKL